MTYALLRYGPAHRGMVARAIVHIVRYANPLVLAKIPAPWNLLAGMVLHAIEREAERHIAGSAALLHPAHVYESAGVVLSDQETEDAVVARLPRIVRLPARYAVRHVLRVLADEAMREAGRMREEQTT